MSQQTVQEETQQAPQASKSQLNSKCHYSKLPQGFHRFLSWYLQVWPENQTETHTPYNTRPGKAAAAPVLLQEDRTKKEKKGLPSARLMIPVPVRKEATELVRKAQGNNATQSPLRQINRTVVTTSLSNVTTSYVEAVRDVRTSKSNSLHSPSSSTRNSLQSCSSSFSSPSLLIKGLPARSRASKSIVEKVSTKKNGVEKSPVKIRSSKSAVVKPEAEKAKSSNGHVLESRITDQQCSSSNENNKMDSAEERTVRGMTSGSIITRENEASPRKLKIQETKSGRTSETKC